MDAHGATRVALEAVEREEDRVHAWAFLDPDRALAEAARAPTGPLSGLTAGVKDVFDTADQPTEYGSAIFAGFRPRADAATVALLRSAGAVVLGKTVTTELAWFTPGPTENPNRAGHTPGGSSSGSAAAVAAGMVDLALGTQTAGSTIRPASFCGVLGYKSTFGAIPTAGVKPAAPSLDTVGVFARDIETLDLARVALTGQSPAPDEPSRFAFVRTDFWDDADPDCRRVVEAAAGAAGAEERSLPSALVGLAARQPIVQAWEGARALAWERTQRHPGLSEQLTEILDWGASISYEEYRAVQEAAARGRQRDVLDDLFGDVDVLIAPAVLGEAPVGLSSTGDPRFQRLWTLLGLPVLSVPGLVGDTGLPIGVQLIARHHADDRLVAAGRQLQATLQSLRSGDDT